MFKINNKEFSNVIRVSLLLYLDILRPFLVFLLLAFNRLMFAGIIVDKILF